MEFNKTVLFQSANYAYELSKMGVKTYTQNQHLVIPLLKAKTNTKFHELNELLVISPLLPDALDLEKVPDYTTMCRALQRLNSLVFQLLLVLSGGFLTASGKLAEASTGFDRRHASKHYVKRAKIHVFYR